jgi:hypothetical protein
MVHNPLRNRLLFAVNDTSRGPNGLSSAAQTTHTAKGAQLLLKKTRIGYLGRGMLVVHQCIVVAAVDAVGVGLLVMMNVGGAMLRLLRLLFRAATEKRLTAGAGRCLLSARVLGLLRLLLRMLLLLMFLLCRISLPLLLLLPHHVALLLPHG